jgi:hypothetical protein
MTHHLVIRAPLKRLSKKARADFLTEQSWLLRNAYLGMRYNYRADSPAVVNMKELIQTQYRFLVNHLTDEELFEFTQRERSLVPHEEPFLRIFKERHLELSALYD